MEVPTTALECIESQFPEQNREGFLRFMREMLRWLPDERKSAGELIEDQWLKQGG